MIQHITRDDERFQGMTITSDTILDAFKQKGLRITGPRRTLALGLGGGDPDGNLGRAGGRRRRALHPGTARRGEFEPPTRGLVGRRSVP